MQVTFCDNCDAQIEHGVMMNKIIYDLCNMQNIKVNDICAPCYSKLLTILDSAVRNWRKGENK